MTLGTDTRSCVTSKSHYFPQISVMLVSHHEIPYYVQVPCQMLATVHKSDMKIHIESYLLFSYNETCHILQDYFQLQIFDVCK